VIAMQRTLRLVAYALLGPGLLAVGLLWCLLWFIAPLAAAWIGGASVLAVLWLLDAPKRERAQRRADEAAAALVRLDRAVNRQA